MERRRNRHKQSLVPPHEYEQGGETLAASGKSSLLLGIVGTDIIFLTARWMFYHWQSAGVM